MPHALLDRMSAAEADERHYFSVAVAVVVSNLDLERSGSVQVKFPWMPGIEPWARVAMPMAGDGRGTYFIPQKDDEVLVAFNHGDILEPYVIGSLWNGRDRPPARELTDPVSTRMIRTPVGHELTFDDLKRSITVASPTGHKITVGPDKVEIVDDKTATHRITVDKNGITLKATTGHIALEAPQGDVRIKARHVEIRSTSGTEVKAGGQCVVKGAVVRIN